MLPRVITVPFLFDISHMNGTVYYEPLHLTSPRQMVMFEGHGDNMRNLHLNLVVLHHEGNRIQKKTMKI